MELIAIKLRKANKNHTCDSCLCKIHVGEQYHVSTCADGGQVWSWKEHRKCNFLASVLFKDLDTDIITTSDYQDAVYDECAMLFPEMDDAPLEKKIDKLYEHYNNLKNGTL